jgi:ectoine hydroxylase-related dioxygenase (phytanoyl-CoA dioxygenase family)
MVAQGNNDMNSFQLKHEFSEKGYVVLRHTLSEQTIKGIFDEIESLFDETLNSTKEHFRYIRDIDDKYFYLKHNYPKLKSRAYDLIKYLSSLQRVASLPRLVKAVGALVETPMLVDGTQVRIDDKGDDRLLPFHQEVFGQISAFCITAWIPLVDVDEENGAMRVIPESHKLGKLEHGFYPQYNNYHGVKEGLFDPRAAVYVSLRKGDAVLFHPLLVHGSSPNRNDSIRWTFVSRYNSIRQVPYLALDTAPLRIEQKVGKDV